VGAGSLGQTLAALLAEDGNPVTLLSTSNSTARLIRAGSIRLRGLVSTDVSVAPPPPPAGGVAVTDDPADLPPEGGLLFATKAHHLAAAAKAIRGLWPSEGNDAAWVAGVQNGLLKDDILAEAFGAQRVIGAATTTSAERKENGEILFTNPGITYLGDFDSPASARTHTVARVLSGASLPAEAADNIRSVLWSKMCNAAGIFGVSLLIRTAGPRLLATEGRARAYLALIKETATVGRAFGIETADLTRFPPIRTFVDQPLQDSVEGLLKQAASTPEGGLVTYPSMLQDLLAGRSLEADEVFGDLVRRARSADVMVPRLELVAHLISGLDSGRQ